jgi:hypothetical protein
VRLRVKPLALLALAAAVALAVTGLSEPSWPKASVGNQTEGLAVARDGSWPGLRGP